MIASVQIQQMFDAVAPGYDRANQILSLGVHHRWRRRLVRMTGAAPSQSVLDCATGTGDLAFTFKQTVESEGRVVGIDFSGPMIALAQQKARKRGADIEFLIGDVLHLPYASAQFDIASIAFGIRNVDAPLAGVREMARVVRPGGKVAILEFGQPDAALFGRFYRWYSNRIIPTIGGWITGKPSSYRYLSTSSAAFPAGERFLELMRESGSFSAIKMTPFTFKIAYAYIGTVK